MWDHLPEKEQPATAAGVEINAADLLPAQQTTYCYADSLTTPPYTEGMNWFVMTSPVPVSKAQVEAFQKIYNGNARLCSRWMAVRCLKTTRRNLKCSDAGQGHVVVWTVLK